MSLIQPANGKAVLWNLAWSAIDIEVWATRRLGLTPGQAFSWSIRTDDVSSSPA